mmetsp:Transcript_38095/g.74916  ORF Transcript_38095/g.74916 Transcript_38095/m.74916 type:complete len:184 (-) Transcript_38095:145-696(-)|eukprot:CAMPEP_0175120040 /NCGR_PEP_ID=MMETSP0087-20121206/400_1 /TAXON_ID=136419 /ORGANISM="Unknown Unknown, Strain D1" /LENGTH=183 /DNA_ID=CAMNT_0016401443 /DNA_START=931 /DNA_END=1482 /DNA_ORIENTATION=+
MILFLLCFFGVKASLLVRDKNNPCVAYGNASTFNITSLFNWPVQVTEGGYIYNLDCRGGVFPNATTVNIAVGQQSSRTGIHYNAGEVTGALWFAEFNWFRGSSSTFQIMYPASQTKVIYPPYDADGEGIRVSHLTFVVDKTVPKPTIEMLGEKPYTEYNFVIRGKCIGQPDRSTEKGYCDPAL